MRVITRKPLVAFAAAHPDAGNALDGWYRAARRADWMNLAEVRRDFPATDGGVRVASGNDVTVFNIGGNKYRLVTAIKYQWRRVYILKVMTHAEYDKNRWKREF